MSYATIPFWCGAGMPSSQPMGTLNNGSFPTPMCLNSGVCNVTESQEYCVCPSGYISDNTYGHFPNCGLPVYALGYMFGIVTVITLLSVVGGLTVISKLRSSARRVVKFLMGQVLLNWVVFLCVFAQEGFYEAAAVAYFLSTATNSWNLVETTLTLSQPVYAMFRRSLRRLRIYLMIPYVLSHITQLVEVAFVIKFAEDSNPERYNLVFLLFISTSIFTTMIISAAILIAASALKREVLSTFSTTRGDVSAAKMKALEKRIGHMKSTSLSGALFCFILLGYPISWAILHSFPGQYIYFFFSHVAPPLFLIPAALAFKTDDISSSDISGGAAGKREGQGSKPDSKEHWEGTSPTNQSKTGSLFSNDKTFQTYEAGVVSTSEGDQSSAVVPAVGL